MDKNDLIELIDQKLSIRDIADARGKSFSTIRYWLKKYGLKTKWKSEPKFCKYCHKILSKNKPQNIFCNKSCAASFNNRGKLHNIYGANKYGRHDEPIDRSPKNA